MAPKGWWKEEEEEEGPPPFAEVTPPPPLPIPFRPTVEEPKTTEEDEDGLRGVVVGMT